MKMKAGKERMASPFNFVCSLLVISLLHLPSLADQESYLVYLDGDDNDDHRGPGNSIFEDSKAVTAQDNLQVLASVMDSKNMMDVKQKMIYSYSKSINGFAAHLKKHQAEELKKNKRVRTVLLNKKYKLHTTRSWNFLGMESNGTSGDFWKNAKFGEDVIIGSLDTGVWPESASFKDDKLGPPPQRWRGACQTEGNVACNNKLIGAKYFYKGAEAAGVEINKTMLNARDYNGHGSHTLSIAGGNYVPGVNVFGFGNGTAKGGAPKARLAAYKVCWIDGCYTADIIAGFDAALNDGVDIISASLGADSGTDFGSDATSIGAFKAAKRGVVVVGSAGNTGPTSETVENVAPWFITVAASKMDRSFLSTIVLGDKRQLKGVSLSDRKLKPGEFFPLITGKSAATDETMSQSANTCEDGSLDPAKVKGKIVVCSIGEGTGLKMAKEAVRAGAAAIIVTNSIFNPAELIAESYILPGSRITIFDAQTLRTYINSTAKPTATITGVEDVIGVKPAPLMAAFSSRGPSTIMPEILKPDVTAPGVNILAAYSEGTSATGQDFDQRKTPYMVMSGTSMACPHISGVAALIKSLHRDWSPAAIRSAIMTTATMLNNDGAQIGDTSGQKTTPFTYGAGQVRPMMAADPGLVYDMRIDDYLFSLCSLGLNATQMRTFANQTFVCPKAFSLLDLNYPSITAPNITGQVTINRRLKNVGTPGTYTSELKLPKEITGWVEPKQLAFARIGEEKPFKLTLKSAQPGEPKDYEFGELIWTDTKHIVKSVITVRHASS